MVATVGEGHAVKGLVKGALALGLLTALGGGLAAYRFGPWVAGGERPGTARHEAGVGRAAAPTSPEPRAVAEVEPSAATKPSPDPHAPPTPSGQQHPAASPPVLTPPEPPRAPRPTTVVADGQVRSGVPERLVRLYEGMRPKEAATVLSRLDPELTAEILLGMRERQAAKILAQLPPQRAADLTARLARRPREGSR